MAALGYQKSQKEKARRSHALHVLNTSGNASSNLSAWKPAKSSEMQASTLGKASRSGQRMIAKGTRLLGRLASDFERATIGRSPATDSLDRACSVQQVVRTFEGSRTCWKTCSRSDTFLCLSRLRCPGSNESCHPPSLIQHCDPELALALQ